MLLSYYLHEISNDYQIVLLSSYLSNRHSFSEEMIDVFVHALSETECVNAFFCSLQIKVRICIGEYVYLVIEYIALLKRV